MDFGKKVQCVRDDNAHEFFQRRVSAIFAQASPSRLSEIATWHEGSERDFSSRRGLCGFWANQGLAQARCLGHVWCFACTLAQARWKWVFGQ